MNKSIVPILPVIKAKQDELNLVPVGYIGWSTKVYSDHLVCDGSEYDPDEYPELHKVLNPSWIRRVLKRTTNKLPHLEAQLPRQDI